MKKALIILTSLVTYYLIQFPLVYFLAIWLTVGFLLESFMIYIEGEEELNQMTQEEYKSFVIFTYVLHPILIVMFIVDYIWGEHDSEDPYDKFFKSIYNKIEFKIQSMFDRLSGKVE